MLIPDTRMKIMRRAMSAYLDSAKTKDINTILPRHNSFQESLDLFVAEFETGFNRVSRSECEGLDDDCAGVYWRDGNEFQAGTTVDSWAWE
jgi:hypothetical protein